MTAKLFYSYSHKDEEFREELETHLSILRRNELITEWHDRRISAGNDWEEEINLNLEEADIILLLLSSNFLASDYCYDTETIRALERNEAEEAVVIPIILKPCLWLESQLKSLQSLPRDNKAITTCQNQDEAWLEVAEGILEKVKDVSKLKKPKVEQVPADHSPDLVMEFLRAYSKWYFSPLRIQKWGSRQRGFSNLAKMTTSEILSSIETAKGRGGVKTKKSQKGNTIYRAI